MIDRIPPKKTIARIPAVPKGPPRCSEAAFREMTFAMNSKADRVVVRIDMLEEIIACHRARDGAKPDLEETEAGRKYVTVDRIKLMAFVGIHGMMRCDAPKGAKL